MLPLQETCEDIVGAFCFNILLLNYDIISNYCVIEFVLQEFVVH